MTGEASTWKEASTPGPLWESATRVADLLCGWAAEAPGRSSHSLYSGAPTELGTLPTEASPSLGLEQVACEVPGTPERLGLRL